MGDVLAWAVVAGALVVVELLTLAAVAGLLAGGALAALLTALVTDSVPVELAVFAGASALLLVLVRPAAVRLRSSGSDGGGSPVVGATAVAVEDISSASGQVRLHGELWRARPAVSGVDVPAGASVVVQSVDGATVLVLPDYPVLP